VTAAEESCILISAPIKHPKTIPAAAPFCPPKGLLPPAPPSALTPCCRVTANRRHRTVREFLAIIPNNICKINVFDSKEKRKQDKLSLDESIEDIE
jgi:hypothetical protein